MAAPTIWTTQALCDELARRKNLSTDYGLAKNTGADRASVMLWRRGVRVMSDEWGARFAAELDIDPAWICLCLAAERADDKMAGIMRTWLVQHGTAAALAGTAFTVVSALALLSPAAFAAGGLCILCSIADAPRRSLRLLIARSIRPFRRAPSVGILRAF